MKVALPQSQKVHWYGQPLFVSQDVSQSTPTCLSTKSHIELVRYGDGISPRSFIRSCGDVLNDLVDIPLTLDQSLSSSKTLKIFLIMYSPSPCTKISTNGYLSKNPLVSSGTCGPPKIIKQFGFCFFTSLARCSVIFQFQT